jgi:hypothetical protein
MHLPPLPVPLLLLPLLLLPLLLRLAMQQRAMSIATTRHLPASQCTCLS